VKCDDGVELGVLRLPLLEVRDDDLRRRESRETAAGDRRKSLAELDAQQLEAALGEGNAGLAGAQPDFEHAA
jgi:hypothetical protein